MAVASSAGNDWLDLNGRVCVVTGAGSGIGAEAARALAAAGCRVAVLDRDEGAAAVVAAQIGAAGAQAIAVSVDVSSAEQVGAAAARVEHALGACQVLVNNAAIQPAPMALMDLEPAAWNELLSVNLTGAFLCSRTFGRQMIERKEGGVIINVASLGADMALANSGSYCVGKAGMVMLTRQLAVELAPHRIRCNTVKPGLVHTPATEHLYADPDVVRRREQLIPAGRISAPRDLANVITFLASDRSDYINGEDVMVDGGVSRTLLNLVPRPERPRP
jgi:NAD(P)-dependent dehydrogenase (short-subunit alcohol dehydrogenase family)